jgi:hypothetical protein
MAALTKPLLVDEDPHFSKLVHANFEYEQEYEYDFGNCAATRGCGTRAIRESPCCLPKLSNLQDLDFRRGRERRQLEQLLSRFGHGLFCFRTRVAGDFAL